MSHFTSIQTQLRHPEALIKALADLGLYTVEVHAIAQHLHGFAGDIRSETAEIIIRRQFLGPMSNDIGFKRQPDETFQAIISEYDRLQYSPQWLDRLTQRYAYHALVQTAPMEGFAIEQEEVLPDGTIRLVLGRWV
ncbi:DUF1257 domain-containing protein [Egbenema bharatensis]|uniref:DUF1257 domain-containing protein n=1 Tax=Egbenema bharatensis TaxID=3463334 RepID=UPI003A89D610